MMTGSPPRLHRKLKARRRPRQIPMLPARVPLAHWKLLCVAGLALGVYWYHESPTAREKQAAHAAAQIALWQPPGAADRPVYGQAVRAEVRILRVRRAGVYAAELRALGAERSGNRRAWVHGQRQRRYFLRYDARSLDLLQSPPLRVLLRINHYELYAGCVLDARLLGRARMEPLPDSGSGYGRYLAQRGFSATLRMSRRYHVRDVDCARLAPGGQLQQTVHRALTELGGIDYRDPRYGLIMGLVLGNSGWLQRDLKRGAQQLGVLHLFAASGLHLGILYACMYLPLARWLGRRDPRAAFVPLLPCALYLLALDVPVSLLRAFCFLSVNALQTIVHRHVVIRELLVNSAGAVLLIAPQSFFQIGTALSFGAVGGILYFARTFRESLFANWRFAGDTAAVSAAASLLTAPCILLAFDQHPALGLLANLVLVPLIALLLPLVAFALALAYLALKLLTGSAILLFAVDGAWWLVLTACEGYLILIEILVYLDLSAVPLAVRDGGLRLLGVRALPLAGSVLVALAVYGLRVLHARSAEAGTMPRATGALRLMAVGGLGLLAPPGVWLELWLMAVTGGL